MQTEVGGFVSGSWKPPGRWVRSLYPLHRQWYIFTQGDHDMPKLEVEAVGTFEVPQGKRLVNALSDEAKIDQLHACGGNARCTTCRVQFINGEPAKITKAEKELLE